MNLFLIVFILSCCWTYPKEFWKFLRRICWLRVFGMIRDSAEPFWDSARFLETCTDCFSSFILFFLLNYCFFLFWKEFSCIKTSSWDAGRSLQAAWDSGATFRFGSVPLRLLWILVIGSSNLEKSKSKIKNKAIKAKNICYPGLSSPHFRRVQRIDYRGPQQLQAERPVHETEFGLLFVADFPILQQEGYAGCQAQRNPLKEVEEKQERDILSLSVPVPDRVAVVLPFDVTFIFKHRDIGLIARINFLPLSHVDRQSEYISEWIGLAYWADKNQYWQFQFKITY